MVNYCDGQNGQHQTWDTFLLINVKGSNYL